MYMKCDILPLLTEKEDIEQRIQTLEFLGQHSSIDYTDSIKTLKDRLSTASDEYRESDIRDNVRLGLEDIKEHLAIVETVLEKYRTSKCEKAKKLVDTILGDGFDMNELINKVEYGLKTYDEYWR